METEGMHRAEVVMMLGNNSLTSYVRERGFGMVDSCKWVTGIDNRIRCDCQGSNQWPCPAEPISDPGLIGGPIEYLVKVCMCSSRQKVHCFLHAALQQQVRSPIGAGS